jgi:3-oxoacyl-[acyl-carrier protein] reductase
MIGRDNGREDRVKQTDVMGLQGKRALVVGGGFGMGRCAALLLGDLGAHVAVADMDLARARSVQAEVEQKDVRATALSGDVTRAAEAEAIVEQAAKFHGGLDVLINIVGMAHWSLLLDLESKDWDQQLSLNLVQHLHVARAAARLMKAQGGGGRIAMVASVSGIYGAVNHGAYGVAKAGLMSLARTMAQEWAPFGIRVNTVSPDVIATPRVKEMFAKRGVTDVDEYARTRGVPLERWGKPEEIAGPLVFLCSDLAGFITGQNLIVDGGNITRMPTTLMKAPS